MSWLEMRIFLNPKNKGILLGKHRLALEESYKNLCLIAPTGSGKTTRYVIPNILRCTGSVVVTDPSGEIFQKTSGHMKKRGYKIQVLSPADLNTSLRFNPLSKAHTPQELKQVATTLGMQNGGSDPFWTATAINLIYICLSALSNQEDPLKKTLGQTRKLLNNFGVNGEGINDFMTKYLDEDTFSEYKAFLAQDSKVISSILSSARASLELWSDPNIVEFTSKNTIDVEALRSGKTAIYIIVPEHQVKYFSIIINLFYSTCFEYCLQFPKGNSVFFFLDEFGNLGKINNFETIATTLRKRKCSINIILQELSQLEAVYGRNEAKTIFAGGMGQKLFFSGLDLDTCTYLERVLGKSTKQEYVERVAGQQTQMLTVGTSLLTADQIRMIDGHQAILISGKEKPIKLAIPPYFVNRKLLALCKMEPSS